jgi:anti-sigma-K factor RskA
VSEPVDYLLGELDPARAAAFESAMAVDPRLRDEVERLRPTVSRLERLPADAWEDVTPPPLRLPAGDRPAPARRRRRLVLRPVVAALCAVALLAAGAGLGAWLDRGSNPPADGLALRPVGRLDPAAGGQVDVAGEGVNVHVSGLRPTGARQFYELWLLGRDGRLVGLGSFRVDDHGAATLKLPLPVDPDAFRYFDISLEPADGDPGHSGVSVLRGRARRSGRPPSAK